MLRLGLEPNIIDCDIVVPSGSSNGLLISRFDICAVGPIRILRMQHSEAGVPKQSTVTIQSSCGRDIHDLESKQEKSPQAVPLLQPLNNNLSSHKLFYYPSLESPSNVLVVSPLSSYGSKPASSTRPIASSPSLIHASKRHSTITRSKSSIPPISYKEIPSEPCSIKALLCPGWTVAIHEELTTLAENQTWDLVPCSPAINVVGCKRVYKAKLTVGCKRVFKRVYVSTINMAVNPVFGQKLFPVNDK
ncbi:hypothetical protein Acr_20g0010020 [Actinidia rufa]|uniref:Uncharacterized protein n=1 Tax=Actinidia rufa TaxID=165716 RepID=A0A7J0GEG6_9ERIC|nr:hypothetical protein Acr_20g0010020 [Actinidia rufa]